MNEITEFHACQLNRVEFFVGLFLNSCRDWYTTTHSQILRVVLKTRLNSTVKIRTDICLPHCA